MTELEQLNARYDDLESVQFAERGDLVVMEIAHATCMAEILLQGAQLIAYTPTGEKPVIWRSAETFYAEGTPIRGGIPVIGPWFGNLTDNPQIIQDGYDATSEAQAHGFLRNAQWHLVGIAEDENGVTCTLGYNHDGIHGGWAQQFDVVVRYHVSTALNVSYEVHNASPNTLYMSAALHTYFAVGDITQVSVEGFDGCTYIDALDDRKEKLQKGSVKIDQETDVVFLGVPRQQIISDVAWSRQIAIETQGSESTILWNPWRDKAKTLSMFGNGEYREMLCIETARVENDLMKIEQGTAERWGMMISCETH